MRVINLIENTPGTADCLCEHGLSFYIETKNHKLLADTGASDAFLANAEHLGIDLKQVDTVVLSHGHYDHGGGLAAFARLNPEARIWMHRVAGEAYYHRNAAMEKYIGISREAKSLPGIEWVEGDLRIDEELFLFGHVTGRRLWPQGNRELMRKTGENFEQDEFLHEQYLVVEQEGKRVLVSGCAHNGILNILDRYREIFGDAPDAVISGFHMSRRTGYGEAELNLIRETARELKTLDTRFYTGHCTGELPFQVMKEFMGEQLQYVHSGEEICLDDLF